MRWKLANLGKVMTGVAGEKDGLDLRRVLLILRAVGARDAGDEALLLAQLCGADIADLLWQVSRSERCDLLKQARWRLTAMGCLIWVYRRAKS